MMNDIDKNRILNAKTDLESAVFVYSAHFGEPFPLFCLPDSSDEEYIDMIKKALINDKPIRPKIKDDMIC